MKKLRIAVWHNLPSGGGKRALYDEVKGRAARGHYLESWCPPSAYQNFLPLASLIKENIVPLESVAKRPRGPFKRRKYRATETGQKMRAMEEHCRRCGEEISVGGFDLLLAHPCLYFRASPIANYVKMPSVLYLAEPFRELYEAAPYLPWRAPEREYKPFSFGYWDGVTWELLGLHNKRVQLREEYRWVKSFSQVLVNSLFSRESLMRAYNLDSRVCYLGIDTENFKPTGKPKEPYAIGLGGINPNKRPLLAVRAIGAIPAKQRPRLVWVGNFASAEATEEVQQEAKRLNVDFSYKVLVPDEELRDLLSRAAVMIYTSYLEPFGYAPLEANSCGTGVVAVAEGGVRESVGDPASGILVPTADPQELGNEVVKFTSDLGFATEFGKKARSYVEAKWSQAKAIDRLEAELERALRSKVHAQ